MAVEAFIKFTPAAGSKAPVPMGEATDPALKGSSG